MAGYTNEYYQKKADNKNKQLLEKKATDLQKILEESASKLAQLNAKKSELENINNSKKATNSDAALAAATGDTATGEMTAEKSNIISILKGLGNSGNVIRAGNLIKGNANFKAASKVNNANNENLKQDTELNQKKSEIISSIASEEAATKNKANNLESVYKNNIEKLISDIVEEQERYRANLYRSIEASKIRKSYK